MNEFNRLWAISYVILLQKPKLFRLAFIGAFVMLTLFSCDDSSTADRDKKSTDTIPENVEIAAATLAGNFSSQSTLKLDSSEFDIFFSQYTSLSPFKAKLLDFYQRRNFAFAWFDVNGQIEQAGNLYNRLQHLPLEGVQEKVPYINQLDSLMEAANSKDEKSRYSTELMLTGLYFYFAERVWGGIDESKSRQIDWFLPRKKIDYDVWLDTLLQAPDAFSKTPEPVYRQYHLLKRFLQTYRDIDTRYRWQPVKAEKKSYRKGDSGANISEIKDRLSVLGDLQPTSKDEKFDSLLENGVKNFQKRFGMKEDGIIGPQMIRELNVSFQKRIQQIVVNMERSRWLPDAMQGDYLAVNIPEFKLHAYHDDSLVWTMNVVVGKSVNKTVIFSGNLKYVVFSPYWNVPSSILKNEILPGIRKNKNYLQNHHMEWNGNSVRQKPGPWNSLGQVKFLFPNSFSIYLHDTPSKGLFNDDKRAFSHGCIRVAEPKKLAQYLLRKDPTWNDTNITRAMSSGKEQYVTLKEEVPVFIAYFTVWVDRQGKLNFRDDIYDRDDRLAEMVTK